MKTGTMIFLSILVGLIMLGGCGASSLSSSYNVMVQKDESVNSKWAQVQNAYQRRMDLIPNLMNTVKGAAQFEKSTLEGVITARSKATAVTIDASKLSPETIKNFQLAQDGLSNALSRLMVVSEKYPDLKSNAQFTELMSQLEGTENRISVERRVYNETAQEYNTYIRGFPNNFIAGWFNFIAKPYFESAKGAEKAPEVKF